MFTMVKQENKEIHHFKLSTPSFNLECTNARDFYLLIEVIGKGACTIFRKEKGNNSKEL